MEPSYTMNSSNREKAVVRESRDCNNWLVVIMSTNKTAVERDEKKNKA